MKLLITIEKGMITELITDSKELEIEAYDLDIKEKINFKTEVVSSDKLLKKQIEIEDQLIVLCEDCCEPQKYFMQDDGTNLTEVFGCECN